MTRLELIAAKKALSRSDWDWRTMSAESVQMIIAEEREMIKHTERQVRIKALKI